MLSSLGHEPEDVLSEGSDAEGPTVTEKTYGTLTGDTGLIKRLVQVDQKPIGRTPRSNLATYTGLFDHIRKLLPEHLLLKTIIMMPDSFLSMWQRSL